MKVTDIQANGEVFRVFEATDRKCVRSSCYNYNFDKGNGFFQRWGKTKKDDPRFSPAGPEIADIEISIDGCPNNCSWCYKSNTPQPATNMTFETFKQIVDKLPRVLTQIAFGITGIQANPDFLKMMKYCREIGVIPNFTLSGIDLTDEMAAECAKVIGAVAVSAYQTDKNVCYDTVKKFTDLGITQTNVHLMVSAETLDFTYEVLQDRMNDPRLAKMNAIVFLGVKPKGRAKKGFTSLTLEQYEKLVSYCFDFDIPIGFDSCSAPKFEAAIKQSSLSKEKKQRLIECSESCESSAFSAYINTFGEFWYCSFTENEGEWKPINVLEADDFLKDVWYADEVVRFRTALLDSEVDGCRRCIVFPQINP